MFNFLIVVKHSLGGQLRDINELQEGGPTLIFDNLLYRKFCL